MQGNFWLEKWQKGETGFHQEDVNPWLLKFWDELKLQPDSPVFVPLCGKSRDMIWLKEQRHPIVGVELSDIAVKDFFIENGLTAQTGTRGKLKTAGADGIRLFCGDFFDMTPDDVKGVKAVFDRAALIALPQDVREKYARHMTAILPRGVQMLLVTIDYPQHEMQGPPFSVTPEEVETLYGKNFNIRGLERSDILSEDRLKARGLSRLHDNVLLLTGK